MSAMIPKDAEGGDCTVLAGGGQDARDVALVGAAQLHIALFCFALCNVLDVLASAVSARFTRA